MTEPGLGAPNGNVATSSMHATPPSTPKGASQSGFLGKMWSEFRQAAADIDPRLFAFYGCNRILPEFSLVRIRTVLFRFTGSEVGDGGFLLGKVSIVGPRGAATKLQMGQRCLVGAGVTFGLDGPITLGNDVCIGPGATLYTGTHQLGVGSRRMGKVTARPIVVEDGVWIGMQALILPGVRLGRGCVIGAGAVVHENVPPNSLVRGNPATVVKKLALGDR
jgi:maltose O-acetyltransferase